VLHVLAEATDTRTTPPAEELLGTMRAKREANEEAKDEKTGVHGK
jgi:hypothetical protein